jgi:hypothetical protein
MILVYTLLVELMASVHEAFVLANPAGLEITAISLHVKNRAVIGRTLHVTIRNMAWLTLRLFANAKVIGLAHAVILPLYVLRSLFARMAEITSKANSMLMEMYFLVVLANV